MKNITPEGFSVVSASALSHKKLTKGGRAKGRGEALPNAMWTHWLFNASFLTCAGLIYRCRRLRLNSLMWQSPERWKLRLCCEVPGLTASQPLIARLMESSMLIISTWVQPSLPKIFRVSLVWSNSPMLSLGTSVALTALFHNNLTQRLLVFKYSAH